MNAINKGLISLGLCLITFGGALAMDDVLDRFGGYIHLSAPLIEEMRSTANGISKDGPLMSKVQCGYSIRWAEVMSQAKAKIELNYGDVTGFPFSLRITGDLVIPPSPHELTTYVNKLLMDHPSKILYEAKASSYPDLSFDAFFVIIAENITNDLPVMIYASLDGVVKLHTVVGYSGDEKDGELMVLGDGIETIRARTLYDGMSLKDNIRYLLSTYKYFPNGIDKFSRIISLPLLDKWQNHSLITFVRRVEKGLCNDSPENCCLL